MVGRGRGSAVGTLCHAVSSATWSPAPSALGLGQGAERAQEVVHALLGQRNTQGEGEREQVESGGEANICIENGEVTVNGEVELRKRNKLRDGYVVEFRERKITIKA